MATLILEPRKLKFGLISWEQLYTLLLLARTWKAVLGLVGKDCVQVKDTPLTCSSAGDEGYV